MKKITSLFFSLFALIALSATSVLAAMDAADETAILAGISGTEATFYTLGAGLLVVLAGIWGFKRVKSLLGS